MKRKRGYPLVQQVESLGRSMNSMSCSREPLLTQQVESLASSINRISVRFDRSISRTGSSNIAVPHSARRDMGKRSSADIWVTNAQGEIHGFSSPTKARKILDFYGGVGYLSAVGEDTDEIEYMLTGSHRIVAGHYRYRQPYIMQSDYNIKVLPTRHVKAQAPTNQPTSEGKEAVRQKQQGAEKCTVCSRVLEVGMKVVYLPCSHNFHTRCIDRWLAAQIPCCQRATSVSSTFGSLY